MKSLKATFLTLVLFVAFGNSAVKAQPAPTEQQLRTYYSLFNEYAKNADWAMAVNTVDNVKKHLPAIFNLPQLRDFRPILAKRIIDTYKGAADLPANTPERKTALLDSVVTLYSSLPAALKRAGTEVDLYQWTFEKGYFLQNRAADLPAKYHAEIFPTYMTAFELNPTKLDDYYKIFILKSMIDANKKDEALTFSEKLRPYLSNEQSVAALDAHINNMFSNPAERITFLEGQIQKNPKDIKKIDELVRLYNRYTTLKGKSDTLVTYVMDNLLPDSTLTLTTTLYSAIGGRVFNNDINQIPAALVYFNKAVEVAKEVFEIKNANNAAGLMNMSQQNFEASYNNGLNIIKADSTSHLGFGLVANSMKTAAAFLELEANITAEEKLINLLAAKYYDKAIALCNPTTQSTEITKYTDSKTDGLTKLPSAATINAKGWTSGMEIPVTSRLTWVSGTVILP